MMGRDAIYAIYATSAISFELRIVTNSKESASKKLRLAMHLAKRSTQLEIAHGEAGVRNV